MVLSNQVSFGMRLLTMALTKNEVHQCVYYQVNDGQTLYVALYVNDILIFFNMTTIKALKSKLDKKFKVNSSVLGIKITREKDTIKINQSQYIANILARLSRSD